MPAYRQQDVQNPHFQLPMKFGGANGGALVNEQDTGEDIVDCIKAIVAFTIGDREDMPEFGIPDILFRQFDEVIIGQVRQAIEEWEERAAIDVDGGFDITDAQIWNLLVRAGVTSE